jgi:hypothetical protein
MSSTPNKKDEEIERMKAEFLAKGGTITKGKTKPMPSELGISNSTWNNKLSKTEKVAKEGKK